MALTITFEPKKDVNGIIGAKAIASTQFAVEFQRDDWSNDLIASVLIGIDFVDWTFATAQESDFSINDKIYVLVPISNTEDFVDVVAVTPGANLIVRTTFPEGFLGNYLEVTVFNNNTNRVNHAVEFIIRGFDYSSNLAGPFTTFSNLFFGTSSIGKAWCELGDTLMSQLRTFVYTSQINYRETYQGFVGAETPLDLYYIYDARRQLFSEYGSNLGLYLANANVSGKWATDFLQKKIYASGTIVFVFTISLLNDSDCTTRFGGENNLPIYTRLLDVNKNEIDPPNTQENFPTFVIGSYEFSLSSANLPTLSANPDAKYVEIYVEDLEIGPNIVFERYLIEIVRIDSLCEDFIIVEWINSLGVFEQYLFSFRQDVEDVSDGGVITELPVVSDIGEALEGNQQEQRQYNRFVKKTTQYLTCYAENIPFDEMTALHEIKHSDFVHIWLNRLGSEKIGVIIEDIYTTDYNSRSKEFAFSVKLRLPDNFDIYSAINYE
jgi:hypothetical protein